MPYIKNTPMLHLFACVLVLACVLASMPSYSQKFSENEVKSAFLYKVTKFIRWGNYGNIVFCTIGEDEGSNNISIAKAFKAITKGKNPPFTVKSNISLSVVDSCNILYIDQSNSNNLKNIFSLTAGKSIVTVSSIKSFSRRGGMFGFITDSSGRIKLELNKKNAAISNVDIKTSLLEIIKIVD